MNVLEAMCADISGMAHHFSVIRVSANRVTVEYSNPDEYANDRPMQCQFPCYSQGSIGTLVVLDIARIMNETPDHGGEGWQSFQQLMDAPSRNPNKQQAA